MNITSTEGKKTTIIDSTSENLANELKKFGLNNNISSIQLNTDNIEDIILSIVSENANKP